VRLGFNVAETPRRSGPRPQSGGDARKDAENAHFPHFGPRRKKSPGIVAAALKIFFAQCFQGVRENPG